MCSAGGGQLTQQMKRPKRNAAPIVTGQQEGVENPKDTAKATDVLKMRRENEMQRYSNPTILTALTLQKNKKRTIN